MKESPVNVLTMKGSFIGYIVVVVVFSVLYSAAFGHVHKHRLVSFAASIRATLIIDRLPLCLITDFLGGLVLLIQPSAILIKVVFFSY